ncbi:lysophospholipid acyltransferase family protein [Qingshengfaniella alkalisoli]|uniref:Acyltransferase n=1 Tax=Qingshengfaniella alkalisoli TaxID=2599296 RepID=A0A5B8IRS2_9RHOB|nr:lysophospholipid acyltransferase family protein [Qingshengfaniella alkalisoli]QDY68274.1 acyltransferase [Qingshengfaniella alkalisoli]
MLPIESTGSPERYDKRRLSYATTFDSRWKASVIRSMEWMTGKVTLLRHIREFERRGPPVGQEFWPRALNQMGIELRTPPGQIARIPKQGPLVIVANHPHGLVDGIVLGALIGQARQDYRILTRSLLTGVREVQQFLMPVPFPHEDDALQLNLEMRRKCMRHLQSGGSVALFPSGSVSASQTMFGPAVEASWNPFTAKMILRSGATVLPIRFSGQNSRWYQMANRVSPTLRQGLLLHEVVHALNKPISPIIGDPIYPDQLRKWASDQRGFMGWLRAHTLALTDDQRVGTGWSPE